MVSPEAPEHLDVLVVFTAIDLEVIERIAIGVMITVSPEVLLRHQKRAEMDKLLLLYIGRGGYEHHGQFGGIVDR